MVQESEEAAVMFNYALLDDKSVLTGFETGLEGYTPDSPGFVIVSNLCDLEPGLYRWSQADQSFVPLLRPAAGALPDEQPSAEAALAALAALVEYVRERFGGQMPPPAADWLAWYRNTVDGRQDGASKK